MTTRPHFPASPRRGFTLVEILVSMGVLVVLLALILQLFNGAAAITKTGTQRMETDEQARAFLDRMQVDIAAMVTRSDVDYYLKGRPADNAQAGNDQLAFYSEVVGYSSALPSPVSVVAYRLNSATHRLERLGIGLPWNGAFTSGTPMVFLPVPLASPLPSPLPASMPSPLPTPAWPQAADLSTPDADYEVVGPQVFRFEYYYVLKGQTDGSGTLQPSILSATPWDARIAGHDSVAGLRDVAAIGVAIAVIDPKIRGSVSDAQLQSLADQMKDFADSTLPAPPKPGDLETQWQSAVAASSLSSVARAAVRIYGRTFYLNSSS